MTLPERMLFGNVLKALRALSPDDRAAKMRDLVATVTEHFPEDLVLLDAIVRDLADARGVTV